MNNPAPGLNVPIKAEINLGSLAGPLVLSIPDNAMLYPEGTVYPILGKNPEDPEWEGEEINAGEWQEDKEEFERTLNLTLEVPKTALEQFKDKTIQLRYLSIGESSMLFSSVPVSLVIKD
jgi:hypothetical protein